MARYLSGFSLSFIAFLVSNIKATILKNLFIKSGLQKANVASLTAQMTYKAGIFPLKRVVLFFDPAVK